MRVLEGTEISTMTPLAEWVVESEKVRVFQRFKFSACYQAVFSICV